MPTAAKLESHCRIYYLWLRRTHTTLKVFCVALDRF